MASLVNYSCLMIILPVALYLVLSPYPAAAASARRCHSIYKGFAQCLMALGDSLADSTHREEDTHEIHSICRSWDEFHDCANVAMAGCPEEAATVWESLRQESKKMQFSGNLYDMCSKRSGQPAASADAPGSPARVPPGGKDQEINQESLRGRAGDPSSHFTVLLLLLLPLLCLMSWM